MNAPFPVRDAAAYGRYCEIDADHQRAVSLFHVGFLQFDASR